MYLYLFYKVHAIIERLQNCRDLCSDEDVITKAKDVKVCTVDEYQVHNA